MTCAPFLRFTYTYAPFVRLGVVVRPPNGHSLPRASIPTISKTKKRGARCAPLFWCGRRELNPYDSHHTPLKRARLPVPPLPRAVAIATTSLLYSFFSTCQPFFKTFFFFSRFYALSKIFYTISKILQNHLAKSNFICYTIE